MPTVTEKRRMQVDLRGAHRGGRTALTALMADPSIPSINIQLIDKTQGRAHELGTLVKRQDHAVETRTADARRTPLSSDTDLLALCMDDPSAQLDLLRRTTAHLTIVGQMLACQDAASLGGWVLGFGAHLTDGDTKARADCVALFERIVQLSGGYRTSSVAVTTPILNAPQVDTARRSLYGELATVAREFLCGRTRASGVVLATAVPSPQVRPLRVVERGGRTRRQMQTESREAGEARVYLDRLDPAWLYLVAPNGRQSPLIVELPASDVEGICLQVEREDAAIRAVASMPVFVTD